MAGVASTLPVLCFSFIEINETNDPTCTAQKLNNSFHLQITFYSPPKQSVEAGLASSTAAALMGLQAAT